MASLKFVMSIRDYNDKVYGQLLNAFSDKVFPYDIYNCTVDFKTKLYSKVATLPLTNIKTTEIELVFSGKIAAEISIEDNSVLYYNGPKNLSEKEISVKKLRKYFKRDIVDENFEAQIELIGLRMVHTIILTMPWLDINNANLTIFIDDKKFKNKEYITY